MRGNSENLGKMLEASLERLEQLVRRGSESQGDGGEMINGAHAIIYSHDPGKTGSRTFSHVP